MLKPVLCFLTIMRRKQDIMLHHHRAGMLISLLFFLSIFANNHSQACNENDRNSLLSFARDISTLTSAPLDWSSSNSVDDCCSWEGIFCNVSNNRVIQIWLPFRGLKGQISPSIQNLTFLSQLNLSHNSLSGHLPEALFTALNQLQIIDLISNHLSGELPLSNILPISIQAIDLSSNLLQGRIPTLFLKLASNLASFNVSNNSFTGPIPPSICAMSPSIKVLDFSFNQLFGQIPTGFGSCSKLEIFRAGSNKLEGSVPIDIYSAASLQEIFLPVNELGGILDEGIASLTNLRVFNMFANGFIGKIPNNVGKLVKLEELQLHINNLTGSIPVSLMNCTNLKILNLRVNNFQGKLSDLDFSALSKLAIIDLGNNNFTGSLPKTLFSCKSLRAIRLSFNQLQGQISPNIAELKSLSFLSISVNNLSNITGAITTLTGCKNLTILALAVNFFQEALPGDMDLVDKDSFQNIRLLALGACQLTGQIPNWIVKLKKLEVLDLSLNQITGYIPGWLGNFSNLFYLDLSYNFLEGKFPLELTRFPRLTSIRIEKRYDNIQELPFYRNPFNLLPLPYTQPDSLPPTICVRINSLSGNIPQQIGLLKSLHALDLSLNNFSGHIPDKLSNLTNLEYLDLSGNNLSGEIPASLKALHFLSSFSVANNSLQGPIPRGGQFDTFSNSSFEGNPQLCGSVVNRTCSLRAGKDNHPSKQSTKDSIPTGLIISVCLGFGFGFTITILAGYYLSKLRRTKEAKTDNRINANTISLGPSSSVYQTPDYLS